MSTDSAIPSIPGHRRRFGFAARYAYETDQVAFLRKSAAEFGDVFCLDRKHIVICDPGLMHQVFTGTGREFRAGHDVLNGFTPANPQAVAAWLRNRRIGSHAVSPVMLAAHGSRLDESLTRQLRSLAGRDVAVVDAARRLMSQAAVDFCIARGQAGVTEAASAAAAAQLAIFDSVIPALSRFPSRAIRRGRMADRRLAETLAACVAARPAPDDPDHPQDLLDALLGRPELGARDITRTLKMAVSGSHAVPGAALSWVIRELGSRPGLADDIRAESGGYPHAIASGSPDALPATSAAIKEILRLFPPVWLMMREVVTECTLGPWRLIPGQQVLISSYLVHRDGRWWPDPDEFRPERWRGGEPPHARHAYIPFGAGPRMCFGYRLGALQLVLAASKLAADYDIQLIGADQAPPVHNSNLTPAGLRMRLTPR